MGRAYYNEFDPGAAAWLRELIRAGLIAPGEVDERSILDVRADELSEFTQCHFFAGIGGWSYALRLAGWPDDRPVWTGSPPCQPFSVAGQGLSRDDPRHLAPHFIRLVRDGRPSMLFGEQVASAEVFGKVAGSAKRKDARAPEWAWLDDLQNRLEAAHYAVGASDIPAAGVGAPHIRQRTFFGAYDLRSASGRVDNANSAKPEQSARQGSMSDQAPGAGAHGEPNGSSDVDRMADAAAIGQPQGRPSVASQERDGFAGNSAACGMADKPGRGCGKLGGEMGPRDIRHADRSFNAPDRTNPLDGFWANADWLGCRDGKWRPVEPGTFPLAHGVSGRVGQLRGYGNAICPQAAKEFIEAFEEVMQ